MVLAGDGVKNAMQRNDAIVTETRFLWRVTVACFGILIVYISAIIIACSLKWMACWLLKYSQCQTIRATMVVAGSIN